MPTDDVARIPPRHRKLTDNDTKVLHYMVAGDPRRRASGGPPRRYAIGIMARKLFGDDATDPILGKEYRAIIRLAHDGYITTAGGRRYAYFTTEQRRVALDKLVAAGRIASSSARELATIRCFGHTLTDEDLVLLRHMLRFPRAGAYRAYDLWMGLAPTWDHVTLDGGAETDAALRNAGTHEARVADERLRALSHWEIISRIPGIICHYYLTKKQFQRLARAFHQGLLGLPHAGPDPTARDENGRRIQVGVAVSVLAGADETPGPIQYMTVRESELPGRVEKYIGYYEGVKFFLVDHGPGGKFIHSQHELGVIPPALPVAPSVMPIVLDGTGGPVLAWSGSHRCRHRVERKDAGGRWKSLGIVRGSFFCDHDAAVGEVNVYRVKSVNKEGESEPCPELSIMVPAPAKPVPVDAILPAPVAAPVRIIRPRRRIVDVD